ncbi:MAG TPA: sigma 54-interacting transcriptional regulator [Polyangiaceae bacterium]|nr:sigma 54-interacting transcriptional regulator [Polyangiaceae bacterium]
MSEKPARAQPITVPVLLSINEPPRRRRCVLVFTEDRARTFALPDTGEFLIGRSEECEIHIDDPSVSRRHARLEVGPVLRIVDLGSANGTRVGEAMLSPNEGCEVGIGTVVGIASSSMLIQSVSSQPRLRPLRSHSYFEARLEDEFARSEHISSNFAVIRLRGPAGASALIEEALSNQVRTMDVVAIYAPDEYEVLLVDADQKRAESVCNELVAELRARKLEVTLGFACGPSDARTPERLISAAGESIHGGAKSLPRAAGSLDKLEPLVARIAAGNISVLIQGETGVGKEMLAQTIHRLSPRSAKPLLCLNCASLSEGLLESELFGYERGAFTGAVSSKPGLIESADGSSILLDEVGEMPLLTQAKLLRILEQRQVRRLGSLRARSIDVRFISATNRDLEAEVAAGRFRSDLYYRLNGATLVIEPLRERAHEIRPLAELFVREYCAAEGRAPLTFSPEALFVLEHYSWPGNIRELRNVVERAALLCTGDALLPEHLPLERMGRTLPARLPSASPALIPTAAEPALNASKPTIPPPRLGESPAQPSVELEAFAQDRQRILAALEACAGNQSRAAKLLGVSRRTLINRIEALHIARPRKPIE